MQASTLEAAGYIFVFTTLSAAAIPASKGAGTLPLPLAGGIGLQTA